MEGKEKSGFRMWRGPENPWNQKLEYVGWLAIEMDRFRGQGTASAVAPQYMYL